MKVKIYGAGSIGNHLTQACRRMGWDVIVVDTDAKALERMRKEIYPSRYGAWDDAITLCVSGAEPKGGFDIIMIGTPPYVRTSIALAALEEKPKILFLEKPVSFPFDPKLKVLERRLRTTTGTRAFVGYDHAVAISIERVVEIVRSKVIGEPLTLDVEFREHWEGIFKAHPWLKGPQDSYLGYWKRGGGASGEHSHALHLAQYLSKISGMGRWKNIQTTMQVVKKGKVEYDSIASFAFTTDKDKTGRVIQDVITKPTRKWARIQGSVGFVEWICNGHPSGDIVRFMGADGNTVEEIIEKKRPDDFYAEVLHLNAVLRKRIKSDASPIALSRGLEVMKILEQGWRKK